MQEARQILERLEQMEQALEEEQRELERQERILEIEMREVYGMPWDTVRTCEVTLTLPGWLTGCIVPGAGGRR